ncbi:MAG: type I polyketide synthase, partial [Myxococcota bacterium]
MSDSDEINESDIAIVGMACRFPGADTPAEYWDNLRNGVESISFFTEDELLAEGESPARLRQPNYVPAAGAMSDMEMFDGEFFGFSPKESAILDPQHRHFLEVSWEALEDAAHPPERFDGPIGVYAGCGMGSYFYFNLCSNPALVNDVGMFLLRHTGNDKDFLATRVSYLFNLSGPAVNVQTACSTSLVAVHLACQSLLGREIDMAIAGGVTIEIPHRRGYLYHEGEVLSPDGHCHAFDHRGQGTVFGSGAGAVVLRRLEDAIEDRDHIYAVIRSSAINNDGSRKVGYLAPSVDGQAAAMVEAHELGEVAADTIGYVECHGTGTAMGDPIEVSALTQAFRQSTDKKQFCRIGSVKTNIGHLDTAAGVASLIKAALALHHGELPPTLNFEKPNPSIEFAESPFIVNDALTPWPRNSAPRRAAVNSLGVGGTNAHAVLEEAPLRNVPDSKEDSFQLLCFSGKSGAALDAYQKRLLAHLESADVSLADVAFTLAEGRQAFSRRRVLAVRTKDEAIALLREPDPRRVFTHTAVDGEASLAFMFPGGGSQYPAMGRGLYESEPVYRNALDRGLRLLQDKTGEDDRRFFFPDAPDELNEELALMRYQLPTIFLTEYALAQLWMDRGLRPAALIGHSMGENTAACIAGVISFEDCLSLVLLRGQLMDKSEPGAMLSISLPANQVEELMGPELELSIINGPELACVSGPAGPIEALEEQLAEQEIEAQRLRIPIAAHSRLLDSMLPEFRAFLESIPLRAPTIPFVSNLTGTWIRDDEARSPEYWTKHVRQTVRFADGVGVLLEEPNRVLLEVGPGRTLTSLARSHPRAMPSLNAVGSLRHRDEDVDDRTYLGSMFGRLWAAGAVSDLSPLFDEDRQRVSLPTYAFQHQPYFIEPGQHAPVAETEAARIDRVEDWGSEPFWTRHYPELGTTEAHTWLFFMDDLGVGESLARRLQDRGDNVVRVFPGDAYGRKSPTAFTLSPERGAEGYETLIRELVQSGYAPDRIVHGWLLTAAETFRPGSSFFHRNLERGFYSLFFLGKALQDDSVPRPLHLTVLTNGMQQVRDEALPYPEKATVLGPARVIPRELPGITCRTLDVQLPEARAELFGGRLRMALADPFAGKRTVTEELERLSDSLFEELQAEPGNGVAAYRGDKRYALRYRPVPLATPDAPGLRDGMTLLITGGLGGLGLVMAEHCANVAKVNLVLVGRRGLPPRDTWDEWLKTHSPEEVTAR